MLIKELYERVPEEIDLEEVTQKLGTLDESNPLRVVLLQEISRYNLLLALVRHSLVEMNHGIQGLVVVSEELE